MTERLDPAREAWMTAPATRAVLAALTSDGTDARFVGGAVRNALLGAPVADIDIATPLPPDEVARRLTGAGLEAVPTGIAHGTITAVAMGKPVEVTTLRRDVTTDGRRATVAYTTDWEEDARRRDFTMNAIFAAPDGEIFDPANGIADLKAGRVRFVGDPVTRIREDYLRILRLFRFHAWYGRGEIERAALAAATAEKGGLAQLSGERVRTEILKLLAAPNPGVALRAMAATGILAEILPWNLSLARLQKLVAIDKANFFAPDAVLRLAALLPADEAVARACADRLKLSNAERARIRAVATATAKIVSYLSIREVRKLLYRLGAGPFKDLVFLRWAEDPRESSAMQWRALLALADAWERPEFPLDGKDVMVAGVKEGPLIGKILAEVEDWWIDSDFTDDRFSLIERLKAVVQAVAY